MSMIINADDFGKSEEVNRAIVEVFDKRLINRTTLMVNMPYADDAVRLAEKNGCFHAQFYMTIKHRLYMNSETTNQVYYELKAQLQKYQDYNLCLWHIDSHHHVHTDYSIYRELKT